jgi:hypothetical protein
MEATLVFSDRRNDCEWTVQVSSKGFPDPKNVIVEWAERDSIIQDIKEAVPRRERLQGAVFLKMLLPSQRSDVLFDAAEILADQEVTPLLDTNGALDEPDDYDDDTTEDDP